MKTYLSNKNHLHLHAVYSVWLSIILAAANILYVTCTCTNTHHMHMRHIKYAF